MAWFLNKFATKFDKFINAAKSSDNQCTFLNEKTDCHIKDVHDKVNH